MISIIDDTGHERFLGNLEPASGLMRSWPIYGDVPSAPMIARADFPKYCRSLEDSYLPSPPHDQDGIGMCNCSATVAAMERARAIQGLPTVRLSGGDLYLRISGGRDQGSMLEDGIAEAMANGVSSVAVTPYLQWRSAASGAAEDRKRFKVLEAFLCPTFDHCFSAVCCGFSLISGIMWYNNYKPDGDGWLPTRGSGGGGGHAVMGYAPIMRAGKLGIAHLNSWGDWGLRGRCVFPEEAYRGPVGGWWAVRSMTDEGAGELPAPRFQN